MQLYWRETRGNDVWFLWSDYNGLKLQNMKEKWLEFSKSLWQHPGELNAFHFLRTDCGLLLSVDKWKIIGTLLFPVLYHNKHIAFNVLLVEIICGKLAKLTIENMMFNS